MKKKMSIVVSSLLFVATAQALSIKDDLQNSIEIFKKEDIRIISAKDIDSVYQLKLSSKGKSFEGYITKDKKYIFFGTALDLKTGKQLFVQTDMSKYDDKQAFEFGTGKDEYYVFTDPECPYCKKFEAQWDKLKSKVKFHTFLFPLSFHKNANDMSLYILNQKNNADKSKALIDISLHNDKKYETIKNLSVKKKKVLVEKLNNQMKIAKEMFVNGAPAVFDKLGRTVRWDTLIKKYDLGTLDTKVIDILVKQKTYIKYGSGKKKLYLFTDVDCPFCKKEFTSGKLDKLAKDYTIYVFLHPLTKLHPQSFAKSAFILSQKTNEQKVKQLKRFFKGAVLSKKDKASMDDLKKSKDTSVFKSLSLIEYVSMKASINSTPSMYDENGNKFR